MPHKHHRHHRHHCKRNDCSCNRQEQQHKWGHHERFAEMAKKARSVDQQKAQMKKYSKRTSRRLIRSLPIDKREERNENPDPVRERRRSYHPRPGSKGCRRRGGFSCAACKMAKQFRAILTLNRSKSSRQSRRKRRQI